MVWLALLLSRGSLESITETELRLFLLLYKVQIFLPLSLVSSQGAVDPVYFYIGIIFGLQGIYIGALFVTSWMMSGTWLAGILTAAWFIINRYKLEFI